MPRSPYVVAAGFAAGVAAASVNHVPWSVIGACALLAICISALRVHGEGYAYAGMFLIALACGCGRMTLSNETLSVAFRPLVGIQATVVGTLDAAPDIRETSEHLTLSLRKGSDGTRLLATVPLSRTDFRVGDRVRVSGAIARPAPFITDGGRTFPYDRFLAKDGILLVAQPAHAELIGHDTSIRLSLLRTLQDTHDLFVRAVARTLSEPERALAIGIITGGKQGLGPQLLSAFGASGMLQIVVLSGYNVTIVADGLLRVLSVLPLRIAFTGASLGVLAFVFAAGASSSALRAALMALIALVARATGRSYDALRALALALLALLLWNPLLLAYDPGFDLSFLATAGLIIGAPLIEARILHLRPLLLREALATTASAQLAVLPLLLYGSGGLSFVAIPANAAAMPIVPAAMGASGVAAACGAVPHLPAFFARACGMPAFGLLAAVIWIAQTAAALPFAYAIVPAFPFWLVLLMYALLALMAFHERVRLRRRMRDAPGLRGPGREGRERTVPATPPPGSVLPERSS